MTSSMEKVGLKTKSSSGGERSIYLLFHSRQSIKAAALFEVQIETVIRDGEEFDIVTAGDKLTEVITLYDQNRSTRTKYAACTPFGKHSLLFLPNEYDPVNNYHSRLPKGDFTRPSPRVFNLLTKKLDTEEEATFNPPSVPKVCPFAVTLTGDGDNSKEKKIYVLSRRYILQEHLPYPSFEAYDTVSKNWEILPKPWFNDNFPTDLRWGWTTIGYAVFHDFLIFCLENRRAQLPTHDIWSYDTLNKNWKHVSFTKTPLIVTVDKGGSQNSFRAHDDDEAAAFAAAAADNLDADNDDDDPNHHSEFRMWDGQAVVIGNFIYGYIRGLQTFVSFSCSKVSQGGEYDISLGDKIIMERIDPPDYWDDWTDMEGGFTTRSGAVGQIGDDLICMVRTIFSASHRVAKLQPVHIKTFRILGEGEFTGVSTFDLYMPRSEQFYCATLASCFTVRPDKEYEEHDSKRLLSYKDTMLEMMDTTRRLDKEH